MQMKETAQEFTIKYDSEDAVAALRSYFLIVVIAFAFWAHTNAQSGWAIEWLLITSCWASLPLAIWVYWWLVARNTRVEVRKDELVVTDWRRRKTTIHWSSIVRLEEILYEKSGSIAAFTMSSGNSGLRIWHISPRQELSRRFLKCTQIQRQLVRQEDLDRLLQVIRTLAELEGPEFEHRGFQRKRIWRKRKSCSY